ncbi:protein kinase domain-containing protein [Kitasatospora sp. LaBMicrA B282]|uniref:serine/threonine-protein kinase n=1 Tax=Kitasatospora sp. LaBMicrA B282 TaxID=3420949 RepID=UPI003D150F4E
MQPLAAGDPQQVGEYRLLGRLGAGGMGQVFLGRSPGGRTVAVKLVRDDLAADGEFRDRFRREVASARKVGGQWTAPVLDADTESATPWVATGYVAGPALADAVTEFGVLPEHDVRALTAGLAEAVAAVHGLGLIHRDIKPSNVMLSPDGPRLIDFGIARAMDGATTAGLTQSGVVIGSPGYMSPEQVLGESLGAPSDVFQLGAVLVFAATGRGPFAADTAGALLYKVAHGEPDLGGLSGELRGLALACLAKAPGDRPTPHQLAARLAPQGAAALVREGWLPAPLLGQLSRRMSELLDLEGGAAEPGTRRLGMSQPTLRPKLTPEPELEPSPTPTARATVVERRPAPEPSPEQLAEQKLVAEALRLRAAKQEAEDPAAEARRRREERHAAQEPQRAAEHKRPATPLPSQRRGVNNWVIALGLVGLAGLAYALASVNKHNYNTDPSATPGGYQGPLFEPQSPSGIPDAFLGRWSGTIPGGQPSSLQLIIERGSGAGGGQVVEADYELPNGAFCPMTYQPLHVSESMLQIQDGSPKGDHVGVTACNGLVVAQLFLDGDGTLRYSGGTWTGNQSGVRLTRAGS